MPAIQTTAPATTSRSDSRSWVRRHKLLTVFAVFLLVVAVVFYFFGWPLVQWRFHPLFKKSLDAVRTSAAASDRLGEPIKVPILPLPAGRVYSDSKSGEARFDFTVVGPKDKADVESLLRMVNGEWGFTALKIRFPDKTIDLCKLSRLGKATICLRSIPTRSSPTSNHLTCRRISLYLRTCQPGLGNDRQRSENLNGIVVNLKNRLALAFLAAACHTSLANCSAH